ncbi:predicted protein [Naegleria gruberi]|uniref:Predicted protein n=1 Tax=Naegleria gruberi TaxID=5762 RepID=D2VS53_NAEGR|nr:uncharacterized protein NAEGRDRAFT_71816 [Naegleria gruberi]EFC40281.1 predicted protein [Naegleria gruberi]|eukprot:XP_002673025.1 predicted protein [Naegleria gruberi strain NEG-M]
MLKHFGFQSLIMIWLFLSAIQSANTLRIQKGEKREMNYSTNATTIGTNFKGCTNFSAFFTDPQVFLEQVVRNAPMGPMKCKNIEMWKRFKVPDPYQGAMFFAYEQYTFGVTESFDLCESIQIWEEKLQTTCIELLFNSLENDLSSKIQFITQNQTTVYDWINYCNYCRKDIQFSKQNYWNIRDDNVREIIEYFPNQISFCGFGEAGIPFVVGMNQIKLQETGYSFICFCPYQNYYGFKCFGNSRNLTYAIILESLFTSIFAISFLITCLTILLPRAKTSFIQKQYYNILVPMLLCLSQICGVLTQIASLFGTDLAVSICSNLTVIFLGIALVSWEMHWIRLIYFVMQKKRLFSFISYLVPLILFISTILAMLTCIFSVGSVGVEYSLRMADNLSYLLLTLGCLITVVFTVCSIVIYVLLKKVSEVSLINSPVSFHLL